MGFKKNKPLTEKSARIKKLKGTAGHKHAKPTETSEADRKKALAAKDKADKKAKPEKGE